jgi:DNA-binding IclR family transcriptional regulator
MNEATELQILSLLAREWDLKGPPGILDVSEIVAALPLAPSDILAELKDLFERGLVDLNSLKTSVFLTPEGYEVVSAPDSGNGPRLRLR